MVSKTYLGIWKFLTKIPPLNPTCTLPFLIQSSVSSLCFHSCAAALGSKPHILLLQLDKYASLFLCFFTYAIVLHLFNTIFFSSSYVRKPFVTPRIFFFFYYIVMFTQFYFFDYKLEPWLFISATMAFHRIFSSFFIKIFFFPLPTCCSDFICLFIFKLCNFCLVWIWLWWCFHQQYIWIYCV